MTSQVDFKLAIYNSAGTCLLYEEQQSGFDLSLTSGIFALQVGSPVGSIKRTSRDPGLSMAIVLANRGTPVRLDDSGTTNTCPGGFTPTNGEARNLRVSVIDGFTTTVLNPDQVLGSQPYALVAQTIQGISPNGLVQINGSANLTQTNAELLVSTNDASALHHHDSLYVKAGGTSNANMGSGGLYTTGKIGIGTSLPATDLEIERLNPQIRLEATSAGAGSSQIQFYSGSTERARIESPEGAAQLRFYTGGVAALTIDGNQNATFSSNILTRGFLDLGDYDTAAEASLNTYLATCGVNCMGTIWYNSTLGKIRYFTGSAIRNIGDVSGSHASGGVAYSNGTDLAVTGAGVAGQVLVSGGVGAPQWTNVIGGITLSGGYLQNVNAPVNSTDAANKAYVDAQIGSATAAAGGAYVRYDGSTPLTANWSIGGYDLNNLGNISIAAQKTLGLGHYTNAQEATATLSMGAAQAGKTWYNSSSNQIKVWTGTTTHSLGVVGGSLSSLNGETSAVQTFGMPGASGLAPNWSSASNVHTLNIPMSSGAGVTAGLLSKNDYDIFNAKASVAYVDAAIGSLSTAAGGAYLKIDGSTALGGNWDAGGYGISNATYVGKPAVTNIGSTIDFGAGNLQYTALACQAFILHNMKDGATYSFAVQNNTVATCSFTAFTGAGTGALTVHMPPSHGATTLNKHTLYSFMVMGSHVYVSWIAGY